MRIINMRVKMAVIIFLTAVIYMSLGVSSNFCQQWQIDEGLESVDLGKGASVLVPKGARVSGQGSVLKVEGANAFSGRKFEEVEKRLDKLEKSQVELRKKIEDLYAIVAELRKNILASASQPGHER